jgi:acyl-CoA reductase-like NAD-dependent aldehyde dehydrogenase
MGDTIAPMDTHKMFIDGEFVDSESGETRPTINPCTEEPIAQIPAATAADAKRAIAAARKAFDSGVWSGMPIKERARILLDMVDKMRERQDELAQIQAADSGMTIRMASMMEIPIGIEHFRAQVELGARVPLYEPLPWVDMPAVSWNFVNREPIGVCAGIVPWNLPFMIAAWKIAPALVMGNCMVLKPASDTPLTALETARIAAECGLPPGVLNVVTGSGQVVGEELCTNPLVDKVAFTGSTETGKHVMKLAADTIKKVTLELGGKSPTIICDDADLSVAVDGALFATFFHAGQLCESGTRCFVPESIYDEFMAQALERVQSIKVGDTSDYEISMGPLISAAQRERVMGYIETVGGGTPCRPGHGVICGAHHL